jgi:hypothetical protein
LRGDYSTYDQYECTANWIGSADARDRSNGAPPMSEVLITDSRVSRRAPHYLAKGADPSATPAGSSGASAGQSTDTGQLVHFGWILGTENIIAVAFDASPIDADGTRRVKAYVCDRRGSPDGLALWFYGAIRRQAVTTLTSTDGNYTLVLDRTRSEVLTGAFIDAHGRTKQFASMRATAGAGIYDVTLDTQLPAFDLSKNDVGLDVRAPGDGGVSGSFIAANGATVEFTIRVRAKVTEAELSQRGMPARFRGQRDVRVGPDCFTAVVSGTGMFWLGRG